MAEYKVSRVFAVHFESVYYGTWTPGEVVELDDRVARHIENQYPDVLTPVVREKPPTPNRQQKRSPKTR